MVEFNRLIEIIAAMQVASEQIIKKGAFDIKAQAAHNIVDNDQVDTGFMKSSVYVVTHDSSTYGTGNKEPPEGAELLPEVDAPSKRDEAIVAVGASYGIYQEMGSVFQPARPYLQPAFDDVAPSIVKAMAGLEAKIAGLIGATVLDNL